MVGRMKRSIWRRILQPCWLTPATVFVIAFLGYPALAVPSRPASPASIIGAPFKSSRPSDSAAPSPVRVRVRLNEADSRVRIRGFDLHIYDESREARDRKKLVTVMNRQTEWEFRCQDGRIRATRLDSVQSLDLKEPVSITTPTGFLNYAGRPYREEIRIYSAGSFCEIVNHVEIEKYLEGLVNAEFSSRWNEEAIVAQVVAARTYAYYQILQARLDSAGTPREALRVISKNEAIQALRSESRSHFDLDATVWDQVYDGSIREDFRATKAVAKSRGLVLTVPGKAAVPVKAFYHSTCGGITELPENVWGRAYPGFKRSVRCPFCVSSPQYRWQSDFSISELARVFRIGAKADGRIPGWPKNGLAIVRRGALLDLQVLRRDFQGRVLEMASIWSDGKKTVGLKLSGARFRAWVGAAKIKSTAFHVAGREQGFRIVGRGFGHGVGMCQWGAKIMGDRGYATAAILKHYYPDAILRKLW